MHISEKNFLERIAAHLPGLAGYREREARRETDGRLRDYLAHRIESASSDLSLVRLRLVEEGPLDLLDEVGRLDRALHRLASSLRHANAGQSGLFDQRKIREEELARIYAYDVSLIDDVRAIADGVRRTAAEVPSRESIAQLSREAARVTDVVSRRQEIFETPGQNEPTRE